MIKELINIRDNFNYTLAPNEVFDDAIKALEQEPFRDMEEIAEVINCDADAETKCKMISNILTAKPHYFEEQESILSKIRTEIQSLRNCSCDCSDEIIDAVEDIIDKYTAESEK